MESTIFQSDKADFISGRHKLLRALEVVEKMGSAEGSLLDKAFQRESSRRCTNMASGRRVMATLSESTG
jgi:hypothetical protein